MKSKKLNQSWISIAAVVSAISLSIVCITTIVLGVYGYIRLNNRITALSAPPTQSSDLIVAIDFLKDQIQFLIWLLGGILAVAGAVLAFFGINTRKSIAEKYEQKYSELVVAKDKEAFQKKIVFLYQNNDDIFLTFHDEIRERGFNLKMHKVLATDYTSKMSDAAVVIYRVTGEDDDLYHAMAGWCELKSVQCILYCPGFLLPKEFSSKQWMHVSISQQIVKLRESLYTILYLTP